MIAPKTRSIQQRDPRPWPGPLAWAGFLLATVLLCYPLWLNRPNLPWGSDTAFASQSAHGFVQALREGVVYPRWIGESNRNFGSPTFIFYPPLTYYAAALGAAVSGDVLAGMRVALILAAFLSGLSFFVSFRGESSELGATVGAVLYVLVPYRALDLYWRFAFAEYIAFIWFPLLFLFTRRLINRPTWGGLAGLAASYAGLLLTHLATAYMALMVLGPYVLCRVAASRRWRNLAPLVGAGVLALLCAAVYLLPMLVQRNNVHLDWIRESHFGDYRRNFAYRDEVAFGYPPAPIKPLVNQATSTQGMLALSAIALLAWQVFRAKNAERPSKLGQHRIEGFSQSVLCVWTFFLQIPLSALVWRVLPELAAVQFPWRFAAFQALAACALVACVLGPDHREQKETKGQDSWPWAAVAIICLAALPMIVTSHNPRLQRSWKFDHREASRPAVRTRVMYEYIPIGVVPWKKFHKVSSDSANEAARAKLLGAGEVSISRWSTHARNVEVTCPSATKLQIRTFAFPGWEAHLDGERVPVLADKQFGSIQIEIPAGTHRIEFKFGSTPDRVVGSILSGLCIVGLALATFLGLRRPANRIQSLG